MPELTDADAPEDDGFRDAPEVVPEGYADGGGRRGDPLLDHHANRELVAPCPPIPGTVPASANDLSPVGDGLSSAGDGRPPAGLLDLSLPWSALADESAAPGFLGRIGPLAASQARQLALLGAHDPRVQWRVILTDPGGHALTVGRVHRHHPDTSPRQPATTSLIGRVTVTIPADILDRSILTRPRGSGILGAVWRAASRARQRAMELARADQEAGGGCAHLAASASYRPPPRAREFVIARDLTCRYPYCGQPAWRGDLDHTLAWHRGGLTCPCNLGPLCRLHHILKQLPGWTLIQARPGSFQWITPAGCIYTVGPDRQPV